ncbi:hypothetical protein BT96DRAFT_920901 [Gymnopus androsaceus JB14]|uniref:EF-hand domain-containing protein n=1 Tax=Gymnopus androsaceus JB14 TaxID=1447944 RepID=A0A6A4HLC4_9AGAR|nr:hypothetical protein BT96DRAFT_920901 [Gymnopus androsaceus JB14]
MTQDEAAQAFFALSKSLQLQIDDAFHSIIKANKGPPSPIALDFEPEPPLKKQKLNAEEFVEGSSSGGGFIVDDQEINAGGGGFVLDDEELADSSGGGGFLPNDADEAEPSFPLRIPLSSIPDALILLDLPPDDEQVLGIFRNAASGWDNYNPDGSNTNNGHTSELSVTQDDWRAVCAVLLEPFGGTEGASSERDEGSLVADDEEPALEDDAQAEDSDVHMLSDDGADPDADPGESDSDYYEPPGPSSSAGRRIRSRPRPSAKSTGKRRARRNNNNDSDSDADDSPKTLSSRQKSACLESFAMFFADPELATNSKSQSQQPQDVRKRRIMLTDIQRVAKLLGEKITAEDMLDMLDMFSTSPDKSMGFEDFERMMVAAKLV